MRIQFRAGIRLDRIRAKNGNLVLRIHAIDLADDTRAPRHLALLEATTIDKIGEQRRELIPPHQLTADTQRAEQQLAAIAELCREALEQHPPSSAKDGVTNPNQDESTGRYLQPGRQPQRTTPTT